jgi:hypothetical protein
VTIEQTNAAPHHLVGSVLGVHAVFKRRRRQKRSSFPQRLDQR